MKGKAGKSRFALCFCVKTNKITTIEQLNTEGGILFYELTDLV